MNHFFDDTPPPCPQCTQNTAVPLVFGTPSAEMLVAQQLGHLSLGGVPENATQEQWACSDPDCSRRF